jgi:hypothetical protein
LNQIWIDCLSLAIILDDFYVVWQGDWANRCEFSGGSRSGWQILAFSPVLYRSRL